ncbi:MAG: hypothetical protein GY838_14605 [bacterium]|nr:hypothetical protein [bacterium]
MMNRRNLILSIVACLLMTHAGTAAAYNFIGGNWRTQYPDVCQTLTDASFSCTLCHNPDSDSLNPYGSDLAGLSSNFVVAESFDSDGDGRNNGQEILLDCTLPGNALSVPEENPTWSAVKALYR